ncbi:hypothetical protein HU200_056608 [Digitaria exilis]|uniref:MATH domain-containing protein n=1 Tax=Digitaria exilis TaxID=1010633 RepID=A0A835AC41_9POAL|nr:hypothetical protein HU200_056608 [Digitaria exilis]
MSDKFTVGGYDWAVRYCPNRVGVYVSVTLRSSASSRTTPARESGSGSPARCKTGTASCRRRGARGRRTCFQAMVKRRASGGTPRMMPWRTLISSWTTASLWSAPSLFFGS